MIRRTSDLVAKQLGKFVRKSIDTLSHTPRPEQVAPGGPEDDDAVPAEVAEQPLKPGVDSLKAAAIFHIRALVDVCEADRHVMLVHLEVADRSAGEVVIALGEASEPPRIFFVVEGTVEVWISIVSGQRVKLREMSAPFYVGEGRMLLNEPATAQVLAKTNCTILSLDQKACAQLKTWGNEALKRIERVMRIRALERKLTATSGTIFTGLKNDPLFMSSILAFANRTGTSEQLHFIFAVEELKQAESLEEALEAFQTIWSSFVDPDVSSDEARKRALKVDLALDDRLALDAIAQPIFAAVNGHAAVTLVDVTSAFDAPSEKCASRVSEEVIPEFMRCDEYEDFVDQMFPIPIPRPNRRLSQQPIQGPETHVKAAS